MGPASDTLRNPQMSGERSIYPAKPHSPHSADCKKPPSPKSASFPRPAPETGMSYRTTKLRDACTVHTCPGRRQHSFQAPTHRSRQKAGQKTGSKPSAQGIPGRGSDTAAQPNCGKSGTLRTPGADRYRSRPAEAEYQGKRNCEGSFSSKSRCSHRKEQTAQTLPLSPKTKAYRSLAFRRIISIPAHTEAAAR